MKNNNNKKLNSHGYIYIFIVRDTEQLKSIYLKFFKLFLNSHADVMDFMQLRKYLEIKDSLKCAKITSQYVDLEGGIENT